MTNIVKTGSDALREEESQELTQQGGIGKPAITENALPIKADAAPAKSARSSCCAAIDSL